MRIFFSVNTILVTLFSLLCAGCASTEKVQPPSYYSAPIARNTYELPPKGNDIIGQNVKIRVPKGDNFDTLAQRFDVGAHELRDANPGINPYRIPLGAKLIIPEEYILPPKQYRKGVVINVAELRLYYFNPHDHTVMTFPVGLGRQGWRTPLGKTYVYNKKEYPTWHVPKAIRDDHFAKTGLEHPISIEPGPDNPLGDRAIYLQMRGYLIHGTNNPPSVGRLVSSGCIRMHNEDVTELYEQVSRGTPVNIIYYPNKAGWRDGKLYLESHTPIGHQEGLYAQHSPSPEEVIDEALKEHPAIINPNTVTRVIAQHSGIPTVIGHIDNRNHHEQHHSLSRHL